MSGEDIKVQELAQAEKPLLTVEDFARGFLPHLNLVPHNGLLQFVKHNSASVLIFSVNPDGTLVALVAVTNPRRPKHKGKSVVKSLGGKAGEGETVIITLVRELDEEACGEEGLATYVTGRLVDSPTHLCLNSAFLTADPESPKAPFYAPVVALYLPWNEYLAGIPARTQAWYQGQTDEAKASEKMEMESLCWIPVEEIFKGIDIRALLAFTTRDRAEQDAMRNKAKHQKENGVAEGEAAVVIPAGDAEIIIAQTLKVPDVDGVVRDMETFVIRTILFSMFNIRKMAKKHLGYAKP